MIEVDANFTLINLVGAQKAHMILKHKIVGLQKHFAVLNHFKAR